jgi:putative spermidine/putrescine transport system permease protein
VLTAAAGLSFGFILLPLVFVVWLAFFRQAIPSFPPQGYSFKWFLAIADSPRFVDGFWLSLKVAVTAMLLGLAIGVPAALCLARYRFPVREPLGNLLLLPVMVPGIVLGTSLYAFHVEASIATGLPILGSIAALMAGHVLIVIPWTVRLVSASLAGFDRSIEEAAQSLGAPPMTTLPCRPSGPASWRPPCSASWCRSAISRCRCFSSVPAARRCRSRFSCTSNTGSIRRSPRCRCSKSY